MAPGFSRSQPDQDLVGTAGGNTEVVCAIRSSPPPPLSKVKGYGVCRIADVPRKARIARLKTTKWFSEQTDALKSDLESLKLHGDLLKVEAWERLREPAPQRGGLSPASPARSEGQGSRAPREAKAERLTHLW